MFRAYLATFGATVLGAGSAKAGSRDCRDARIRCDARRSSDAWRGRPVVSSAKSREINGGRSRARTCDPGRVRDVARKLPAREVAYFRAGFFLPGATAYRRLPPFPTARVTRGSQSPAPAPLLLLLLLTLRALNVHARESAPNPSVGAFDQLLADRAVRATGAIGSHAIRRDTYGGGRLSTREKPEPQVHVARRCRFGRRGRRGPAALLPQVTRRESLRRTDSRG